MPASERRESPLLSIHLLVFDQPRTGPEQRSEELGYVSSSVHQEITHLIMTGMEASCNLMRTNPNYLPLGDVPMHASYKITHPFLHPFPFIQRLIFSPHQLARANSLLTKTLHSLPKNLSLLMSDIEKLMATQRRTQIANPAPLYVGFH